MLESLFVRILPLVIVPNPVGQIIIWTIFFLFFIAIICVWVNLSRFRRLEFPNLSRLQSNVQEIQRATPLAMKRDILLSEVSSSSLASSRVALIYDIVSNDFVADQARLSEISASRERNRMSILAVNYVSRCLILLGLLGTFIGLSILASRFSTLFISIDTTNLNTLINSMNHATAGITKTTEGLITAFSSTLWGLVCTVLLSIFIFRLEIRQRKLLGDLEELSTSTLLPLLNPRDLAQTIQHSSVALAQSADAIKERIESLESSANATKDSIEQLNNFVASFSAATESFDASAKMINSSHGEVSRIIGELSAKLHSVDQREEATNSQLHSLIEQWSNLQSMLNELISRLQKTEVSTESSVRDCLQFISSNQQQFLGELSAKLHSVDQREEATNSQLRSLIEQWSNLQSMLNELISRLQRTEVSIESSVMDCLQSISFNQQQFLTDFQSAISKTPIFATMPIDKPKSASRHRQRRRRRPIETTVNTNTPQGGDGLLKKIARFFTNSSRYTQ